MNQEGKMGNEPLIKIGLIQYPVEQLLHGCKPELEPCDKYMWEHCNETIQEALSQKDREKEEAVNKVLKEQHEIQNGLAKDIQHYTHVAEDVERLEAEVGRLKETNELLNDSPSLEAFNKQQSVLKAGLEAIKMYVDGDKTATDQWNALVKVLRQAKEAGLL